MEYRIEQKEAFKLIGLNARVSINHTGENEEIRALMTKLTPEIKAELLELSNTEPRGLISSSFNFENRHLDKVGKMDRLVGVSNIGSANNQYQTVDLAAGSWAVFTCQGIFPHVLRDAWSDIYNSWLPNSEYQMQEEFELISHKTPPIPGQEYTGELWLPIKLK